MSQPPREPARVIGTRRRRRPTKSGTVLSHELIVATAIRLLGQHGTEALSVRRLGAALGADPSSLYRYFRNADDLVLAVADELIRRSLADFEPSADWRASLRDIGHRIHATYLAHPQAAALSASRVTRRPNEVRAVETGLGVLLSAGFPPREAARHYHSFIDLSLGYAVLDAAAFALPHPSAEADQRAWHATYARLPADRYPNITACADALAETMTRSAYPAALELLLDGIAARLPR
ncbi:TetR/AcrR family transcriptional regulator [Actinomadura kijaniata]|uniref:AcrR family transcriptional regulator n=1 Tax=Actinomadura namibiensis TaxID=182080 RepID=A0A7W3QLS8_ACTNM|nr:TetR/AcrR family transcriptional regulator [Actinomadura namibiensis]MBA8951731.1 AcrR family transcriptional regulator [Actinomadura namibiensis]